MTMNKIHVALKTNPYDILVGVDSLAQIGKSLKALNIGQDAIVITSPVIKKLYGKIVETSLESSQFSVKFFLIPDGEQSKNFQTAEDVLNRIAKYDVFKKPFIMALGGGVVGDLAGFVAAIYKRGIPVVQVPTTFLAQIDSSIGGKTAVDLPSGKNLVGAFHQPKMVFTDVSVLRSLDERQILNGLSEAVKYGVIYDSSLFGFIEKNATNLIARDMNSLSLVVNACSQIKAEIVAQDEKETKGIRTILNFGHTIGHAIEAASQYGYYQHGEAIALGMRVAADISLQMKKTDRKEIDRLYDLLTKIGLPTKISSIKPTSILNMMKRDKKFTTGKTRFVLMEKIGKVQVVEGIPPQNIESAVRNIY